MTTALELARIGVPVLPLGDNKMPLANCYVCQGNRCGQRPNSRAAGPCQCPRPCHGWSAASTDRSTVAGWDWTRADAIGWHPGGMNVTVVDLDSADAVQWARQTLPATRVVPTTRGEHWLYLGATSSRNGVMPKVDVKSRMQYVRWRGKGTGAWAPLPDVVAALTSERQVGALRARAPQSAQGSAARTGPERQKGQACPHARPSFLARGVAMAADRIRTEVGHDDGTGRKDALHRIFAVLIRNNACERGCLDVHVPELLALAERCFPERPADASRVWDWAVRTTGSL